MYLQKYLDRILEGLLAQIKWGHSEILQEGKQNPPKGSLPERVLSYNVKSSLMNPKDSYFNPLWK